MTNIENAMTSAFDKTALIRAAVAAGFHKMQTNAKDVCVICCEKDWTHLKNTQKFTKMWTNAKCIHLAAKARCSWVSNFFPNQWQMQKINTAKEVENGYCVCVSWANMFAEMTKSTMQSEYLYEFVLAARSLSSGDLCIFQLCTLASNCGAIRREHYSEGKFTSYSSTVIATENTDSHQQKQQNQLPHTKPRWNVHSMLPWRQTYAVQMWF